MEITQERLRRALHYDPKTGFFTWLTKTGQRGAIGARAGTVMATGYVRIAIDRRAYLAHRLAWLYMTGEWPKNDIDHINLIKADNRWVNLRSATRSENCANGPARNSSGLKGAYWKEDIGRWTSAIGGKYLGVFDTPEEAHAAYLAVANQRYGKFSRPDIPTDELRALASQIRERHSVEKRSLKD